MVNGYRAKIKVLLEVGVKVHLLWLENPRRQADTRDARPPIFFTSRA